MPKLKRAKLRAFKQRDHGEEPKRPPPADGHSSPRYRGVLLKRFLPSPLRHGRLSHQADDPHGPPQSPRSRAAQARPSLGRARSRAALGDRRRPLASRGVRAWGTRSARASGSTSLSAFSLFSLCALSQLSGVHDSLAPGPTGKWGRTLRVVALWAPPQPVQVPEFGPR